MRSVFFDKLPRNSVMWTTIYQMLLEELYKISVYDCSKRQVNHGVYRETVWWEGQAEGNKSIILDGSRKPGLILHVLSWPLLEEASTQ